MSISTEEKADSAVGANGENAALQVVCLGAGGGPSEEGVTGFLVRSIGSEWARGSILAVDAGSHFAPVHRIMEKHFPARPGGAVEEESSPRQSSKMKLDEESTTRNSVSGNGEEESKPKPTVLTTGPFAGLKLPHETAGANALHFIRTFVSTYLITHPHLDHISGFVMNTAAFHATSRPKTLAALSSTVDAMKKHIFNDVIWPNLTDEDGGVGFVTFQRLKEGGDIMLGEGEGRGYIDVCDGLGVRAWKVSHGACMKPPSQGPPQFRSSTMWDPRASFAMPPGYAGQDPRGSLNSISPSFSGHDPRASFNTLPPGWPGMDPRASFAGPPLGWGGNEPTSNPGLRQMSMAYPHLPGASTPGSIPHPGYMPTSYMPPVESHAHGVVDSTAYFIRDWDTQREVLIFGDVEPDSISMAPRNHIIWQEAARKVAYGLLKGIFIECSYDDSQGDTILFGHLCPRHVIAELQTLARLVKDAQVQREMEQGLKKRKRSSGPNGLLNSVTEEPETINEPKRNRNNSGTPRPRLFKTDSRESSGLSSGIADLGLSSTSSPPSSAPKLRVSINTEHPPPSAAESWYNSNNNNDHHDSASPRSAVPCSPKTPDPGPSEPPPLAGVRIVIIHVKDTFKDGPHVSENILAQLNDYEERLQEEDQALGCEFVIARTGESYWF